MACASRAYGFLLPPPPPRVSPLSGSDGKDHSNFGWKLITPRKPYGGHRRCSQTLAKCNAHCACCGDRYGYFRKAPLRRELCVAYKYRRAVSSRTAVRNVSAFHVNDTSEASHECVQPTSFTDAKLPIEDFIQNRQLPKHVAVIMDGNQRWAKRHNLPHIKGYTQGVRALRELVQCCCEWRIPAVTVFAFSTDNWKRSDVEVGALFSLMERVLRQELPALQEAGVRLHFFGDLDRLPSPLQVELRNAIAATANNDNLALNLALSYSARQDILQATRHIAALASTGELLPEDITPDTFKKHLSTSTIQLKVGEPDLLIRTSGEQRLSDFLLWEMAYTELYFTEVLWPEFRTDHFREALQVFSKRNRRFGMH